MSEPPEPLSTPEQRFQKTCELHDEGVAAMRDNLRRRHSDAGEDELRRLLRDWLHDDSGDSQPDGWSRPRSWIPPA